MHMVKNWSVIRSQDVAVWLGAVCDLVAL